MGWRGSGRGGEEGEKGHTTSIYTTAHCGNGRHEYYPSPALGFHSFYDAFDEDEGGAEVYVEGVFEFREGDVPGRVGGVSLWGGSRG